MFVLRVLGFGSSVLGLGLVFWVWGLVFALRVLGFGSSVLALGFSVFGFGA